MGLFGVEVDLGGILGLLDLGGILHREANAAARDLSAMAHAKATELAGQRLHSRRRLFLDALHVEQAESGTWIVQLDASAGWIEDGMDEHSMLPFLLRSPKAKMSKDGHRYVIVPMRHGPAQDAPASSQPMVAAVRAAMKSRGIPFGKIERDGSGRALVGKLHTFDVAAPLKTAEGPGQGRGTIGDVRQGPNQRQAQGGGPAGGGTPFLSRVSVYQRPQAGGSVRKDIMTFRVASEKHEGQGRWVHPGVEGAHVLADAYRWVADTWEQQVLPAVIDRIMAGV